MTSNPYRLDAPPETLDNDLPVTRLMTHRIVAIVPEAELPVALRLVASRGVRHVLVLDGSRCLGVVLETDVARLLAGRRPEPGVVPLRVGDLRRPAPALKPTARRSAAAQRMHAEGIDAVLVTDGERLLGIVTATDLIRSLRPTPRARDSDDRRPGGSLRSPRSSCRGWAGRRPVPPLGPAPRRPLDDAVERLPR